MRRRARIDGNQGQIADALRKRGASVAFVHTLGRGFPDILAGTQGKNILLEIKDPAQPPSKRKLTPDEQEFHANWRGQVCIVETVDEALMAIGL